MSEKKALTPLACVYDYRKLACKKLPRHFFDFIDGGAYDEISISENRDAFNKILFRKRILRDTSSIETSTEILGQRLKLPIILAPVGFAGVYARRGEVQAAKAAEQAGVPFCLSTVSICSIEEVQRAASFPFWFQLYMIRDKGYCREMLQRAHHAGCPVLLYTVDLPVVGVRYRDRRNGIGNGNALPMATLSRLWQFLTHPSWMIDVLGRGQPLTLGNLTHALPGIRNLTKMRRWVDSQLDAGMTWKDVDWVRNNWPGKVMIKGVMDPEDAKTAVSSGVDGIVVSNHAGRHLDTTPPPITALPSIVDAVGGNLDVLVDGGIFNGPDIVKALALGAKGCMIGRAWAYALAARGEQGVSEVLSLLHNELIRTMAHLSVKNLSEIDKNLIF